MAHSIKPNVAHFPRDPLFAITLTSSFSPLSFPNLGLLSNHVSSLLFFSFPPFGGRGFSNHEASSLPLPFLPNPLKSRSGETRFEERRFRRPWLRQFTIRTQALRNALRAGFTPGLITLVRGEKGERRDGDVEG